MTDGEQVAAVSVDTGAELGRVQIGVARSGQVAVSYSQHPMVRSTTRPWSKRSLLQGPLVEHVFAALPERFADIPPPPATLLPGQDITLTTLACFGVDGQLLFQGAWPALPDVLAPLLTRLQALYEHLRDT